MSGDGTLVTKSGAATWILLNETQKRRLTRERGLREESGVGVSDLEFAFVAGRLETSLQPTQLVCPGYRLTTVRNGIRTSADAQRLPAF